MSMSGCWYYRKHLVAFFDGELTGRSARRVARHADGCAACRQELARLQHAQEALQAWEAVAPSAAFDAAFQFRLQAVRREQAALVAPTAGRVASVLQLLSPRFAMAATAVCAVLIVVAGVVSLRRPAEVPGERIVVAQHMELFQNMDVIENSEALENFELINLLDAFGEDLAE